MDTQELINIVKDFIDLQRETNSLAFNWMFDSTVARARDIVAQIEEAKVVKGEGHARTY